MDSKPYVLIAGVTGMLGSKIASAILDKDAMQVKGLVRPNSATDARKKKHLDDLKARGMVIVEGDLLDPPSLQKACDGVNAVVSAVSGGEESALRGQLNLIQAASATSVKRFIPSDYSVDYFKLDLGDNYNLDFRIKVADALKKSGLEYTFILNGAFTEIQFTPFAKIFDFNQSTFSYWGDGEMPCDMTTIDDTAKYVAEAVADPAMANYTLKVVGDVLSIKELLATYEDVTGNKLQEKRLGSVEELRSWIAKTIPNASSPYEYLPEQYHLAMVSGKGKLDEIHNDRYPHIKPTTVAQYLQQANFLNKDRHHVGV